MERKLKQMMDYQAFENEPNLANTIDSVINAGEELSLDDLDMVAGGVKFYSDEKDPKRDEEDNINISGGGIQSIKRTP